MKIAILTILLSLSATTVIAAPLKKKEYSKSRSPASRVGVVDCSIGDALSGVRVKMDKDTLIVLVEKMDETTDRYTSSLSKSDKKSLDKGNAVTFYLESKKSEPFGGAYNNAGLFSFQISKDKTGGSMLAMDSHVYFLSCSTHNDFGDWPSNQ